MCKFFTNKLGCVDLCLIFTPTTTKVLKIQSLFVPKVKSVGLYGFLCSSFYKHPTNSKVESLSVTDKLAIINNLFEGYGPELDVCPTSYNRISFSYEKFNKPNSEGIKVSALTYNEATNNKEYDVFSSSLGVCGLGMVLFPISFSDFSNLNNYLFNIYNYLYLRNSNCYISSFISLFYCFIGLFFSLNSLYISNKICVLTSNLSLIVSRMSSYVVVVKSFHGLCDTGALVSLKFSNILDRAFSMCGVANIIYRPDLVGLTKYVLLSCGVFSVLSFQHTLKTLKKLVLEDKVEWLVDSKSNLLSSGFIPVGSGWYRYFIN